MKIHYVNYNKNTGEIISAGSGAAMHLDSVKNNEYGYLELKGDHRLHYVNLETEKLVDKIKFPVSINKTEILADGVDSAVISGIPAGTNARVGDDFYVVNDGILEITSDIPETIRVTLKHINYLREGVTIEST